MSLTLENVVIRKSEAAFLGLRFDGDDATSKRHDARTADTADCSFPPRLVVFRTPSSLSDECAVIENAHRSSQKRAHEAAEYVLSPSSSWSVCSWSRWADDSIPAWAARVNAIRRIVHHAATRCSSTNCSRSPPDLPDLNQKEVGQLRSALPGKHRDVRAHHADHPGSELACGGDSNQDKNGPQGTVAHRLCCSARD